MIAKEIYKVNDTLKWQLDFQKLALLLPATQ